MSKTLLVEMLFYGKQSGYIFKNIRNDGKTSFTFKFSIINSKGKSPQQKTFSDKGSAIAYAKRWGYKTLKGGIYPTQNF